MHGAFAQRIRAWKNSTSCQPEGPSVRSRTTAIVICLRSRQSRLSRPQLSYQHPLPPATSEGLNHVDPRAALSYATERPEDAFILGPLVTLPSSFGVLHVGESFGCVLCVNNELPKNAQNPMITGVRITATLQTPSQPDGIPLDLIGPKGEQMDGTTLAPGETFSRIVHCDLREEGTHILQPTVTYDEMTVPSDLPPGVPLSTEARSRTFRKLYQFVTQQLLSVRTKIQPLPPSDEDSRDIEHVLEAQIENIGDVQIVIEDVRLLPKPQFVACGLNIWDVAVSKEGTEQIHLRPGEIQQVCFMLQQSADRQDHDPSPTRDGRMTLGQMSVQWRGPMGESGSLSTAW